jgi:hypothetical protein
VHSFVRNGIVFAREEGEIFQTPRVTISQGFGDCDDHARLVAALLIAGGVPARLAFLHAPRGGPRHVVAQALNGTAWRWLETTLPARAGEDPRAAALRLRLVRTDLHNVSEVTTMCPPFGLPGVPLSIGELSATGLEVAPGTTYRMRAVAGSPQAFADIRSEILAWLGSLGFSAVRVWDAPAELPADWPPQEASAVAPGGFPRAIFWIEATWGPDKGAATLPRDAVIPPLSILSAWARGAGGGTTLSHLDARAIVERAWLAVHGRAPSQRETLYTLAIASFETGYGRAGQFGKLAARGLYNWGAEQTSPAAGVCPPGTAPGGDTFDGRPVSVCFYTSATDDGAAVRLIRTLTVAFPARARAILEAMASGAASDVAAAMKVQAPYYTAPLETYARGLAGKLPTIARDAQLVELPATLTGVVGTLALLLGLGLAEAGLAYYLAGRL